MLGGARIVRVVVLQESRMTASAAVPPAPQSSLSRLPWIHRVNLECHTDGEYCQEYKTVTTHFFGKSVGIFQVAPILELAPPSRSMSCMSSAICARRLSGELLEDTVELGKGLEPNFERDLADAQIRISQEITRVFEPSARDILDKIYASYLLKLFAQMVRVDVDGLRHLGQAEVLLRVLVNEVAGFPDLDWLGSIPVR